MHSILCIAFYTLHFMQCTICVIFYALYYMHCFLCIIFYELYFMHCILYIEWYALYYMHCILCIVLNALYSMHCIQCILLYALYSLHFILCILCIGVLLSFYLTSKLVDTHLTKRDNNKNITTIVTYRAAIAAKKIRLQVKTRNPLVGNSWIITIQYLQFRPYKLVIA